MGTSRASPVPEPVRERFERYVEHHVTDGEPPSPESLCSDAPEHLPRLIELVERYHDLDRSLPAPSLVGEMLGRYDVSEELGRGGMGVVYRAKDRELRRDVAIKVLPAHWMDRERALRFQREGRLLAALDHPSIATLFGVESHGDHRFLVMELARGETLATRLERGPIPWREARSWFLRIADGLEAAHRRGIVHRDLKPANIAVDPDGTVKILDFGLAKAVAPGLAATSDLVTATRRGQLLGTTAYMSPEQVAGERVDPRTDVWAFGCCLYEVLTGLKPFRAERASAVLTAILGQDPDWRELEAVAPHAVVDLVVGCLCKGPEGRPASMADVRSRLLEVPIDSRASGVRSDAEVPRATRGVGRGSVRRWWAVTGAAAALLLAGVFLVAPRWTSAPETALPSLSESGGAPQATDAGSQRQLELLVSSEAELSEPYLSSDGRWLVYVRRELDGQVDLWALDLSTDDRRRLTADAAEESGPAISPDGRRIAFSRSLPGELSSELIVRDLEGGAERQVVENAWMPAWSPNGSTLAFVLDESDEPWRLATAELDGSSLRVLLQGDVDFPFLYHPSWSPDGSQLAVSRSSGGVAGEIWLVPTDGDEPSRLQDPGPDAAFSHAPEFSPDGRAIIHSSNRGGATNLWSQPLDGGPPQRLTTGPGNHTSPSLAADGHIAFASSSARNVLLAHSPGTGETREVATHNGLLWGADVSPDGRTVAFSRAEQDGSWHVWSTSLDGGTPRPLTSGRSGEVYPRFTPDGSALLFYSWQRPRTIFRLSLAGGDPVPLTPTDRDSSLAEPSPDGRRLAFVREEGGMARVMVAPLGSDGTLAGASSPRPLTDGPSTVPSWDPTSRWIAYSPDRGRHAGVWIAAIDGGSPRRLTSDGGWPIWHPAGDEIAYQAMAPGGGTEIRTVRVEGGPSRRLSSLRLPGTNHPFAFSSDGSRLVVSSYRNINSEIWLLRAP